MAIQTSLLGSLRDEEEFLTLNQANSKINIKKYCPIKSGKLGRATGVDSPEETKETYDKLIGAYISNYDIMLDTAILLPCYQEDWRIYFDNTKKKYTIFGTHEKLYTDYVNLLRNRRNQHPIIMYPKGQDYAWDNYIDEWKSINNNKTIPGYRKKKLNKKIKDLSLTYKTMKAKLLGIVCEYYKNWLSEHTEIKYVLIPDISMCKHLFPNTDIGSSFNACCFQRYTSYEYGRPITFMLTLSPTQQVKHEEAGFTMMSEILDILRTKESKLKCKVNIIKTKKQLEEVLIQLQNTKDSNGKRKYTVLSVDTETTGFNPNYHDQHILSAGFSNGEEAWVFMVDHPYYQQYQNLEFLSILFKSNFSLVFQNAKFDLNWVKHFTGVFPKKKVYDTMLIDHWLYEGYGSLSSDMKLRPGLFSMALQTTRYLGMSTHKNMLDKYLDNITPENPKEIPTQDARKNLTIKQLRQEIALRSSDMKEPNSWTYAKLPLKTMLRYLGLDCLITFKVFERQIARVREECDGKLPRVITELLPMQLKAVAEMENNGAPINYDKIIDQIKKANKVMRENSTVVYKNLKYEFNIDSGDQVALYLIKECGIRPKELRTDDRKPDKLCTDTNTLELFADRVPWLRNLIAYKKASKARNTYLIPFIYRSYKGNLYFSLKMTGTATGRLSSNSPNMQNIPKTLGEGDNMIEVKQVIQAPEGKITLDADLKNAEVKVLTAVCPDPNLIKAIKEDMDLHCYTASYAYHTPYENLYEAHMIKEKEPAYAHIKLTPQHKMWQKYRKAAKSTTFLVLYGGSAYGLAKQLPSTYKDDKNKTAEQNQKDKHFYDIKEADKLINLLKKSIYTILGETFEQSDKKILEEGYGVSLFDRRRRYDFTLSRSIYKIICDANLRDSLAIEQIKNLSPNQRPFRQNVNFVIQSSTSDYMQYFICYLIQNMPKSTNNKMWFTVHDSIVGEIDNTDKAKKETIKVFDDAMYKYIPSLHESLQVDIGYTIDFTKEYCQLS